MQSIASNMDFQAWTSESFWRRIDVSWRNFSGGIPNLSDVNTFRCGAAMTHTRFVGFWLAAGVRLSSCVIRSPCDRHGVSGRGEDIATVTIGEDVTH